VKKLIAILLVLFLAACNAAPVPVPDAGDTPPPPPEPPVTLEDNPLESGDRYGAMTEKTTTVRWLIPVLMDVHDYPKACARIDELVSRMNMLLLPHELTLAIELRNVTDTTVLYPNKRDTKGGSYSVTQDLIGILPSKEEYDLISVPTGHVPISKLVELGLLRNISSDIHGFPNLMSVLDEQQLELTRYTGGIWGVPTGFDLDANLLTPYLAYNTATTDTLGIFGADELSTTGDLLYAADRAGNSDMLSTMHIDHMLDAYHREYPQYPFKVSEDYVFLYTQDGQVEPYAGSVVMQEDTDLSSRIWRVNRVFDTMVAGYARENRLRPEMTLAKDFDLFHSLDAVPEERADGYAPIILAEDKPYILYDNPCGAIMNVLPAQASAYGLALLDTIYGNRELYEVFRDETELFGGSEYRWLALNKSPATSIYGKGSSQYADFMHGRPVEIYHYNLFDCVRQSKLDPAPVVRRYGELVADITHTPMPWDGFVFDPTPVFEDYTRIAELTWGMRAETSAREPGTWRGVPSLTDTFIGFNEDKDMGAVAQGILDSGMDVVLEECRRQYAEFLQNKGWIAPAPSN